MPVLMLRLDTCRLSDADRASEDGGDVEGRKVESGDLELEIGRLKRVMQAVSVVGSFEFVCAGVISGSR
eukprot:2817976-Rhodomonas_salina.2